MSSLVNWMDRTLYPKYGHGWDHVLFREKLLTLLRPESQVLDLGAGRGGLVEMDFRDRAARVCGVDVDTAVLANPQLHEARLIVDGKIPYSPETFDLVVSTCVWEHLESPDAVFAEAFRVLKPGGILVGKTPCRLHYVAIIASLTPHWFHEYINEKRGRPRHDTFPTFYRLNTPGAIRKCGERAGFTDIEVTVVEGRPEYMRLSAATYLAGWAYEKIVNSSTLFAPLRCSITAVLRKPISTD